MTKFTITTEYRIDYPEDTGACSERSFAGEFEPVEHVFYALYARNHEGTFLYGASDYRSDLEEVARDWMKAPSLHHKAWISIDHDEHHRAINGLAPE